MAILARFNQARRQLTALLIALLLCVSFNGLSAETPKRDLQWAFMMNFIRYFSWPQAKVNPVVKVCVVGRNPFEVVKENLSLNKKNGKITVVEYHDNLPKLTVLSQCNVIYFSASITTVQLAFVFSQLKQSAIVTIGDHQGFIEIGGIVQFTQKNNKLRFRLNKPLLSTINLKIHPSLLRLSD